MSWKKFSGESIPVDLISEVEKTIERETEAGNKLKVCIGTDSQVYFFDGNHTEYEGNRKKRLGDIGPKRIRYKKLN